MISAFDVWRRNLWHWALPAAFCAINLIVLGVYFQVYHGRVERLSNDLETTRSQLEGYRAERSEIEAFLAHIGGVNVKAFAVQHHFDAPRHRQIVFYQEYPHRFALVY